MQEADVRGGRKRRMQEVDARGGCKRRMREAGARGGCKRWTQEADARGKRRMHEAAGHAMLAGACVWCTTGDCFRNVHTEPPTRHAEEGV